MNIHEYQAKQLLAQGGLPIPQGYLCTSAVEADYAFRWLKSPIAVVKAQVHAGGRGKGGGVKLVKSPEECAQATTAMLGMNLVTAQTGAKGKTVHQVYVETGTDIAKEYYLAMLVDRETAAISIVFSLAGGMDIEEVAEKSPDMIATVRVNPNIGIKPFHINDLAYQLNLPKEEHRGFKDIVTKLYNVFIRNDLSLAEINPLVVTTDGKFVPLDAKINCEDNALFRQPTLQALRDFREEDTREVEASKWGLNYIGLEGNIGCMVNGAGLAMATMDIIKHYGGEPANFLDVGGGASEEMVRQALRIIMQDPAVKAVFVNIFGGIMRCDVIARGIVAATRDLGLKVPIVVRLEGTNVAEGKQILQESGLKLLAADNMGDGAQKAVAAVAQ